MTAVVIHQPDFLPWLGFFHRFLQADLYIALDHVQFVRGTSRSWTHRDLVKTRSGAKWLSLSVQKAALGTPINEILLAAETPWRPANLDLICESYREAAAFREIFGRIEALYAAPHRRLVDMTLASLDLLCELLDIRVPRILSSSLAPRGSSNAMLVDLLRKVGATRYISGRGARAYLDLAVFNEAGIEVVWQNFAHPVYEQLHGLFVPMLSAIDPLFNCGIDRTRDILRSAA